MTAHNQPEAPMPLDQRYRAWQDAWGMCAACGADRRHGQRECVADDCPNTVAPVTMPDGFPSSPWDYKPENQPEAPRAVESAYERFAQDSIDLFLEYRDQHGYDEGRARATAILEAAEGAPQDDVDQSIRAPLEERIRELDARGTHAWVDDARHIHKTVAKAWPVYGPEDSRFLALAMAGEVGELLNIIKKVWRGDKQLDATTLAAIREELADIKIYHLLLSDCFESDSDAECEKKIPELYRRWPEACEGRPVRALGATQ